MYVASWRGCCRPEAAYKGDVLCILQYKEGAEGGNPAVDGASVVRDVIFIAGRIAWTWKMEEWNEERQNEEGQNEGGNEGYNEEYNNRRKNYKTKKDKTK